MSDFDRDNPPDEPVLLNGDGTPLKITKGDDPVYLEYSIATDEREDEN